MTDRAILYARVSTTEQDETTQLPALRRMAEARGYEIVATECDKASGRNANRPGWQKVMNAVRHHRCEVVMAVKVDRVMRSVVELYTTLQEMERCHVRLETGDYSLDPSTASGRMVIGFLGVIGEWEREIISERTKTSLRMRQERGTKLGRPRADIPDRARRMRAQGASYRAISEATGIPASTLRAHLGDEPKREAIYRVRHDATARRHRNGSAVAMSRYDEAGGVGGGEGFF